MRPSACPGLLRIVNARDGGICRIKLPCGQLSSAQAHRVADAAQRYASGVIELTNRANLQIRGVRESFINTESSINFLIETLIDAGLGPRTPGGDDVRNLMVSPSFGIDPDMVCDVTPLAEKILDALQTQPRFHELSPKFAVLLDGGERTAMLEHPHDLWLSALPVDEKARDKQSGTELLFAFGLAGCPPTTADAPGGVAAVPASHALELVEAVLHVFLDHARPEQTRMRHLLEGMPVADFLQHVQQRVSCRLLGNMAAWRRRPTPSLTHIGIHPQRQAGLCHIGAVPPLGRIDAAQLRVLANLVHTCGDGTLRLTPQQSVLLPNIPQIAADNVAQRLHAAGFAINRHDPLAQMIACSGAVGCIKGRADTKGDALLLAQLLGKKFVQTSVHLTGCERSCAAAHAAPFTLLAVVEGHYDLYQRNGNAGLGELIASDLDMQHAAALIMQRV
ncbi:MAG: precorrin-3B synthase [Spongiibacteraceae bacterium]